jgi:hypothetical protein
MYDRGALPFGFIQRCGAFSLAARQAHRKQMEFPIQSEEPKLEDIIESLARTVAHLALQLTVAQLQLRALGTVLADSQVIARDSVLRTTANLAEHSAGKFLAENLGSDLAAMIDLDDLERQIIEFLAKSG